MNETVFNDWAEVGKVAICTAISFMVLFIFIRVTGKRTLASLSAFDFVVIIALGSTLAEMMLAEIPLANGIAALLVILGFQFGLAWIAIKSRKIEKIVNAKPTLLFIDGKFLQSEMDRELVTEDELYSEIRAAGIYNLDDIKAIVLELNGHVIVVKISDKPDAVNHSLKHLLETETAS